MFNKKNKKNKNLFLPIMFIGSVFFALLPPAIYFISVNFSKIINGKVFSPKVIAIYQPNQYVPLFKLSFDQNTSLYDVKIKNKTDKNVTFTYDVSSFSLNITDDNLVTKIINKKITLNIKAKNHLGNPIDDDFKIIFKIDSDKNSSLYSLNNKFLSKDIWSRLIPYIPILNEDPFYPQNTHTVNNFIIPNISSLNGVNFVSQINYSINQSCTGGYVGRTNLNSFFYEFLKAATRYNFFSSDETNKYPLDGFKWYTRSQTDFATMNWSNIFSLVNQVNFLNQYGYDHFVSLQYLYNPSGISYFDEIIQNINIELKNIDLMPLSFGVPKDKERWDSELPEYNIKRLFEFNNNFFSSSSEFWTWVDDGNNLRNWYSSYFLDNPSADKLEIDVDVDHVAMSGGRIKDIPAYYSYNNSGFNNSLLFDELNTNVEDFIDQEKYQQTYEYSYSLPNKLKIWIPTEWKILNSDNEVIDTKRRFMHIDGDMTYIDQSNNPYTLTSTKLYSYLNDKTEHNDNIFLSSFDIACLSSTNNLLVEQTHKLWWPFFTHDDVGDIPVYSNITTYDLGDFRYFYRSK